MGCSSLLLDGRWNMGLEEVNRERREEARERSERE